ncbi:hypothetical protein HAX54_031720, partial [Datura stramonium]|nr:hypothetical protein [Datura stramonium]
NHSKKEHLGLWGRGMEREKDGVLWESENGSYEGATLVFVGDEEIRRGEKRRGVWSCIW